MTKNKKRGLSLLVMATLFLGTTSNAQGDHVSMEKEPALDLNNVVYLEEEEEIALDFDTYFYLPQDFNPYKGMHFELEDIHYLECEEAIRLESNPSILVP